MAFIGAGRISQLHLEGLEASGQAELIAEKLPGRT